MLRGGESIAEDDKDQTISSSSESESLAHLVLGEVGESMSSDDEGDKEVDMMCIDIDCWEQEGNRDGRLESSLFYYSGTGGVAVYTTISAKRSSNKSDYCRTLRSQLAQRQRLASTLDLADLAPPWPGASPA